MPHFFLNFLKKYKSPIIIYLVYLFLVILFPYLIYYLNLLIFPYKNLPLIDAYGLFWDGWNYLKISTEGYSFPLYAFLPGFPLLLKLLLLAFPLNVVSHVNFIVSFFTAISIYKFLDLLEIGKKIQNRILILFFAFPSSFFLISNYVESLYVLISIWILYFLIHKKYKYFLGLGFLLSLLKITSLSIPMLYIFHLIDNNYFKVLNFKKVKKTFLFLLVLVSGVLLYFSYLGIFHGNFKLFFESQSMPYWNRKVLGLSNVLIDSGLYFIRFWELATFIFMSFLLINYKKKLNQMLYLFSLLHFLIPILTGSILSYNRLSLLSFPIILLFFSEIAKSNLKFYIGLAVMSLFQLFAIYLLFTGIFVG